MMVILSLIFCSHAPLMNTPGDVCFFTLAGQGACNIVGMQDEDERNIAFVFDAGIDSTSTHAKLAHFINDAFPNVGCLVRRPPSEPEVVALPTLREDAASPPRPMRTAGAYLSPEGRPTAQLAAIAQPQGKLIQSIFERIDPDVIFVFLSHPDEDHINLVPQIPKTKQKDGVEKNIPTIFFLCGDWIAKSRSIDQEGNTVGRVLEDIRNRREKWLFMPYYWNKSYSQQTTVPGVLEDDILAPVRTETLFERSVLRQNSVTSNIGLGTLLTQLKSDDDRQRQMDALPVNLSDSRTVTFLNRIHFWLLNHRRSDINAQSYVVSCQFPNLDMSFVFTGDADDSTFEELRVRMGPQNPGALLRSQHDKHLIWLFMPHHGSDENDSRIMHSLFSPDAYIITAGNGSQHGHPRKKIVDDLPTYIGPRNPSQFFWSLYAPTPENPDFPFFKFESTNEKGLDRRYPAILHSTSKQGVPVFCTNVVQSLYMDTFGNFYQQVDRGPVEFEPNRFLQVKLNRHRYEMKLSRVSDQDAVPLLRDKPSSKELFKHHLAGEEHWFVETQEGRRNVYYKVDAAEEISTDGTKRPFRYMIEEFKENYFLYEASQTVPVALLMSVEERKGSSRDARKAMYGYKLEKLEEEINASGSQNTTDRKRLSGQ
jgi:hypothetical protein